MFTNVDATKLDSDATFSNSSSADRFYDEHRRVMYFLAAVLRLKEIGYFERVVDLASSSVSYLGYYYAEVDNKVTDEAKCKSVHRV